VSTVTVALVDDHPMVRQGLRTFLAALEGVRVLWEAASAEEAHDRLAEAVPDVILLDLVLPGAAGPQAIRSLKAKAPGARLLVLTSFGEPERVSAALAAGADGYLLKTVAPEDLLAAIRLAGQGHTVLDVPPPVGRLPLPEALTPREAEVLALLARGLDNRAIADELGISVKTVKTHLTRIYGKLGAGGRTEALLAAARLGLVELA
jgi:NarL family two-component system response regulator LiaR